MKILFFMESYYCGGVDTFVINLINAWPNNNDKLMLICNKTHSGLPGIRRALKRPCMVIENTAPIFTSFFNKIKELSLSEKIKQLLLKICAPVLRYCFLLYNILALRPLLFKNKPDRLMVINGGYPGGDSCRAATICWGMFGGKPLSIHNFHGVTTLPWWGIYCQERLIDCFMRKFTKEFVTVSKSSLELLSRRKAFVNNKVSARYVYSGIEMPDNKSTAPQQTIKQELGIEDARPLCLMVGNYNYNKNFNKGHLFLFEVFQKVSKQFPDAYLVLCGHGSRNDISRIEKLAESFGLKDNVRCFGFRGDIHRILQSTEVLLVTAQAFESFGLASIEAMAHCVPVVSTDAGALPEIIKDGIGGYCFKKDAAEAYARCVCELLADKNYRQEVGRNGFDRYQNLFTAQRMAKEYAQIISRG